MQKTESMYLKELQRFKALPIDKRRELASRTLAKYENCIPFIIDTVDQNFKPIEVASGNDGQTTFPIV